MKTKLSTLGSVLTGYSIAGSGPPRDVPTYVPADVRPDSVKMAGFGMDPFGIRVLREPLDTGIRIWTPPQGATGITFRSGRGAALGFESSAGGRPRIVSLEWSRNVQGGCKLATITLRELPPFPVTGLMVLQIEFAGQVVFTGSSRLSDVSGSTEDLYKLKAVGLAEQFDGAYDDLTIPGPVDLGEAARALVLAVIDQTLINYNPGKINGVTGVTSVGDIELGKHKVPEVLTFLAEASGHQWGVDEFGDFYFLPIDADVQKSYFVGYDVNEFQPERDFDNITNQVTVKRTTGKASGAAGWVVAVAANDEESIAEHGSRARDVTMPGFFGDDVANALAAAVLAREAWPRWRADIRDVPLRSAADVLQTRGPVRVVSVPVRAKRTVIQNCEDPNDFTATGGLVVSRETGTVFQGAASLKIIAAGDESGSVVRFQLPAPARGFFKKLVCRIWSTLSGEPFEIGAGKAVWDETTGAASLPAGAVWTLCELELTEREINAGGLRVLTDQPFTAYLDLFELVGPGHEQYVLELDEEQYKVDNSGAFVSLKLGPVKQGLENQLAAVAELAEMTSATLEIR